LRGHPAVPAFFRQSLKLPSFDYPPRLVAFQSQP
jgi:hypothetical protein